MEPAGEGGDSCLERLKNSLPGPADLVGAASTLERILRESVCQRQGWLRVYDGFWITINDLLEDIAIVHHVLLYLLTCIHLVSVFIAKVVERLEKGCQIL